MKSLFLADVQKPDLLQNALSQVLLAEGATWILAIAAGDPVAYLSIVREEATFEVHADISERHYHEDYAVAGPSLAMGKQR